MKRILLLFGLLGLLTPAMARQAFTGRVVSAADDMPLPGATIRLKDGQTAVLADAAGYFTLPAVEAGTVLRVSFIGFVPREVPVPLSRADTLWIALQPAGQALQEVVVSTGYQRLPQERATGSFAQVDAAALAQQVSTDVLSRLEGVASGLTVDRSGLVPALVVRGLSTINGPRSPLIVVDNFPYEGDLANLNPNDVESVTILKDAAAASIWGARAGNGVIVITTRKGRFHQPLTAGFNANVTVSGKPDLSYLPQMRSGDFIGVEQFLFENGYYKSQLNSTGRPVVSPVVEILVKKQNGTLSAAQAEAQLDALRQVDVRDAYDKYVYRQAVKQQYALSLQSGSDVLAWHLSAGYDRNLDQLAAGFHRMNLRFQNTLRPAKGLSLNAAAAYTQTNSASGQPGYGEIGKAGNYLFPYAQLADAAGNPLPLVRDYRQAYRDTAGGGRLLDWNFYPLADYRHARQSTTLQDVTADFGAGYSWRHGLGAEVKYRYERQQLNNDLLQDEESYFSRNLVNLYTQLDPATGEATYVIPRGGILEQSNSLLASHNLRGQLNFDKTWGAHALSAIAGAEIRSARTMAATNRLYGYNDAILTFGQVDLTTPYPNFITGRAAYLPDRTDRDHTLDRFVSQFANAAYTFRDRYTLSASGRRDASNLFGLHTNDRWNPLWSAGLGWDISKEPFYHFPLLPYLKLRSTYGFSGNTNPAMTAVTTMAYVATSPYTQTPYGRFSAYGNPDLSWETVGMWNIGLDFSTRNERIGGSLEYYRKQGRHLFGQTAVDYTTGVGSEVVRNVAAMRGNGVDIALHSLNVDGPLRWTSQLTFSYAADKVTDYFLSSEQGSRFITSNMLVSGVEGKPVYAVYAYPWAGLDPQTGNPQGYVDGEVSSDYNALTGAGTQLKDLVYFGSALPTVFGSLGNTLTWKGLSVTARVSWKLGYYFRARSINYATLFTNWGGHADFAQRWQAPGDELTTQVPSLVYPLNSRRETFYAGSAALVEKGDHVRLQYITAAYQFGRSRRTQATLRDLQVYLNLANLGILWRANNKGLDPDVSRSINGMPEPPSLSLGLKATL